MRKYVIAGNWKMHNGPVAAKELASAIAKKNNGKTTTEVVICVPFVDLFAAEEAIRGTTVKLGAQNVHWEEKGAFTGEISVSMLQECGVEYVIIGHSERRQYFGETDGTVAKRVAAALKGGLKVILCVGETLEEREAGKTIAVLVRQTKAALNGLAGDTMKNVIIAYEPVWAIGTGKTADDKQADEGCGVIRDAVKDMFGASVAQDMTIQYGGSMKPANAKALLAMPNIDGGLIGGAALNCDDFTAIVDA
ncbi:MAG TPA: triose-phosphate isomerase, partial [Clostridiales bacterium]|nr:triose-phosphate isomerase [Clostridiales bacterium]